MEFLASLGINVPIIVAIVGLCEFAKRQDKENKYKRFYLFLPFILCILAGLFQTNFTLLFPITLSSIIVVLQDFGSTLLILFGVISFAYGFIKKFLKLKMMNGN